MMDMLFEQSLGCGEVFGDGEDGGDGMGDVVVFDGGEAD